MNVTELLQANHIPLEELTPGRHYTTCPQCSANRSRAHQKLECLGVTIEADGSVRWGCNHCNWTGPTKGNGAARPELTSYEYHGLDGTTLFRKVRNQPGREPRFWLERPNGRGGWIKGTKGVDTGILYRADQVAKAIADGRVIVCAEGEKDADNLWQLAIPATCNAHGASEPGKKPKCTPQHSAQLRGADLVVLNDNDPAGYEHADTTCRLSLGVAKRVRRLDLKLHWPGIPKGGDVSDWLAQGRDGAELQALIDAAPEVAQEPENGEPPSGDAGGLSGESSADAEIARLAGLSPLAYEQARKMAAANLDMRASALDRIVNAARGRPGGAKQGHALELHEPEAWPDVVDGAALLDDVTQHIQRYIVMAKHCARSVALWCVHTFLLEHFLISPRLAIRSPVHRCGKTTLLDIISCMCRRALLSSNVSTASVFRVVEAHRPTLLIDEADTFLPGAEELRGVVNSGHRKGGKVIRTVGDEHEVRMFSTYSAVAIALIGKLPPTLHDRSAPVVDLKRRLRSERVETFRLDRTAALEGLAAKAARWAFDNGARVKDIDPRLPEGLFNRDADNWRPLLAIAEAAGGQWPGWAREAAALCCQAISDDDAGQIEMLLADIRDTRFAEGEITSAVLVARLVEIEGHPWAEMGKSRKPLTQNKLARLLKPLGISPELIGPEDNRLRGYRRKRFVEAFERYLPPENATQSVHPSSRQQNQGFTTDVKVNSAGSLGASEPPVSHCNSERLDGWTLWNAENGQNAHTCAHCGKSDGRAQLCSIGDDTVWLHPKCQRAYAARTGDDI
jgi:hypothetical protein